MKLLIMNGQVQNFATYTEMFKYLATENYYIDKLENGKFFLTHEDQELEAQFGELNVEDSINPFNDEIVEYRKELRAATENLMELGVELDKDQKDRLVQIFSFLN